MTEDELAKAVAKGIAQAQVGIAEDESTKKAFFVPAEEHYQHHDFVRSAIKFMDEGKTTVWKTFIRASVMAVLGIFAIGIGVWLKYGG